MPIYEYLCHSCNRVYSFIAKRPGEQKRPTCPKCGNRQLKKMISSFAVVGSRRKDSPGAPEGAEGGPAEGGGPDPLDDPRVEREMMKLMSEAESLDENDPRQLGHLMRRMGEITGEPMEPEMEEAVRRLEAGDDPEKVEEDMAGFEDGAGGGSTSPTHDSGLYPM